MNAPLIDAPLRAYSFAASSCGGLRLTLHGAQVMLRPAGGLWIENRSMLVVSDLHFEKGSSYAARGQLLPPYDTRETLRRLEAEVAATRPKTLVFLGDSFHDDGGEGRLAADDFARIAALAAGRTLLWAVGNHDAEAPKSLPGDSVDEIEVEGLTLRHEPYPQPVAGEVCGHLHPCARVAARAGSVRRRCFITDGRRLVMPAFGAFTGGLNVCDSAFAGLFDAQPIIAALGTGRVHAVGWRSLRPD